MSSEYIRCLAQAADSKRRIIQLVAPHVQRKKVLQTARQIAASEWEDGTDAAVERFSLSAVTAQGVCAQYQRMQALCPRIYVVCDRYGAVGTLLMSELYRLAVLAGQRVMIARCPLLPAGAPEHLLLPEKGIAFTVSNTYHTVDFPVYRRIHASLLTDMQALQPHRGALERWEGQLRLAVQGAIDCCPQ